MNALLSLTPRQACLPVAAILCLLSMSPAAKADIDGSELDYLNYFGTLSQQVTGPNGINVMNGQNVAPNACVPTATANGLTYLENYVEYTLNEHTPFTGYSPNSYQAVNDLATAMGTVNNTYYVYYNALDKVVYVSKNAPNDAAASAKGAVSFSVDANIGGTQINSMYNGLQNYLSAGGDNPAPRVEITGQQMSPANLPNGFNARTGARPGTVVPVNNPDIQTTAPTASFLACALNHNDGVEIGIQWGGGTGANFVPAGGGHEVTLDYIDLNTTTDQGTVKFIDPEGGVQTTAYLELDNGVLYISDGEVAPPDEQPGNGIGGGEYDGRIVTDMVESVPDGASTWMMLGVCALGLAAWRRLARQSDARS